MALYRGSTKLAGIGAGFVPENSGTTGQVLTKTSTGYNYQDVPQEIPTTGNVGDVLTKTANGVAFQTIETGAPDHLEASALVGEKYALTDTLFKQLTPALDDCTVEANVGYDAATTEIHIQRQGSGTASNTLKLKLKKAGSPANLVVEVRKGVQVDVSSSEAYWYGDSEQVLATGSINASDVTTSWQELEVELDAAVGGTEGELLDIVLYQTASAVSSTNYYVMACDSTQWSEGFSYVKVNGTTRSRKKLMPYCVSGGFAQALLSKVSSSTVTGYGEYEETDDIAVTTGGAVSGQQIYSKQKTDILVKYRFIVDRVNYIYSTNFYGYLNGNQVFNGTGKIDIIKDGPLTTNNTIKVTMNTASGENVKARVIRTLVGNITISKGYNYQGKPRSTTVKYLGEKENTTIFGVHSDKTRFTQS